MKAVLASVLTLAATAFAAPSAPAKRDSTSITFTLINDHTGASAPATISVADTTFTFPFLFGNSVLASNGQILASSAQLISNPNNLDFECDISIYGNVIGVLTQDQTFADLEGAGNPLVPQNVNNAIIHCYY